MPFPFWTTESVINMVVNDGANEKQALAVPNQTERLGMEKTSVISLILCIYFYT